jgi:uncharacterized lipoprotein YmbA
MSRRVAIPVLASAAVALAGCGLLTAPGVVTPKYYVLNAVAASTGTTTDVAIGLGPISLPAYLDRPEIARRSDANQIDYSATQRWAEPLKSNFASTVHANLVQILGPQRLVPYPWYRNTPLDYTVIIIVSRFEEQPDGSLQLDARWIVRDRNDTALAVENATYTRPGGGDGDANAAAMSALVADLSRDIAARIPSTPVAR